MGPVSSAGPGHVVPPPTSGSGRRLQPARGWLLLLALALCGLALPAVFRTGQAVALSGVSGFLLVVLGIFWCVPVALGPVRLDEGRLTVRTARGPRTVDLRRLRTVGGHQMRVKADATDVLTLRDETGGHVVLLAPPGFPAQKGPYASALPDAHRTVRRAVLADEVHDVSEIAKRVLDLPARGDASHGALALALWAAFLAGALAGVVLPVALWGLLVPL